MFESTGGKDRDALNWVCGSVLLEQAVCVRPYRGKIGRICYGSFMMGLISKPRNFSFILWDVGSH